MNDSSPNLASQLLKNNAILPNSPEILGQQLIYMNNLLSINSNMAPNQNTLPQYSKEQITEYQLAKMRLNQELLTPNSFYSFPYNYSPYAAVAKSGPSLPNYNRIESTRYRYLQEDPKPQHSYIGLIAMAILSVPEQKMVLSDIYQHILDHYPYFRNRGPGWRNSIRHNLSLNDCFVKSGRSNAKGHYWIIHPANIEDFKKSDFRRRKAQRKVRKHMGLSVPDDEDDDDDSPVPSPMPGLDKVAVGPVSQLTTPNPFVQAISNPLFTASSPCFSQQAAFHFFNSLRFALPTAPHFNPPASFNEALYKQLINLNIKQDLQSSVKTAVKREFSIESLLSPENRFIDSDGDSESECKIAKVSHEEVTNFVSDSYLLKGHQQPEEEKCDQVERSKLQPVNLKIN